MRSIWWHYHVADHFKMYVTYFKLDLTSFNLLSTYFKLKVTYFKLNVTYFKLNVTYFKLNVTYFNLHVTYFNLPAKRSIGNQEFGYNYQENTNTISAFGCPKFLGISLVFYPYFENAFVKIWLNIGIFWQNKNRFGIWFLWLPFHW